MTRICFVADFFEEDICGGGEKCNEVIIDKLSKYYKIQKIKCQSFSETDLDKYDFFIISNFVFLKEKYKNLLKNKKYIIYEHDHKYVKNRNPAAFKNFEIPKTELVNIDFFKNAKYVIAQSQFHKNIIVKNTELQNVLNAGTSFWSDKEIDTLKKYQKTEKQDICFILDSNIQHKNTFGAIDFCEKNNLKYFKHSNNLYNKFISGISHADKFVFFPKTPETFGRVATECKILGMKIYTNLFLGVSHEHWFKNLQGEEMLQYIIEANSTFIKKIQDIINE
jgi:hypothetical protein